jgi:hypothetical protein
VIKVVKGFAVPRLGGTANPALGHIQRARTPRNAKVPRRKSAATIGRPSAMDAMVARRPSSLSIITRQESIGI